MKKYYFLKMSLSIIIAILLLANTTAVQAEECLACSNRTLTPTPHNTSSAPGYCESHGGSHLYEYIQSVTYTVNPGGTITITVDIYIANPTGCTYGEPCPEYDASPEYINAWIDWDGDKVFEPEERVMDAALTGYANINYHGTMTASNIVTIPENAVSETWMRVNLGWGHDPNDPCEYSWTWGDVVDVEVEIGKPDLSVRSTDISISPKSWWQIWKQPFDISVTVHNDGTIKAENIKVKFVDKHQGTEVKSEVKTITEIPAGGTATVSVNWNLDFRHDIEVIVDPDDEIDELNENNNRATTTKTTGRITNSAGEPLEHLLVVYQEKEGNNWVDKVKVFTDAQGRYYIINQLDSITQGRVGRINARLVYSSSDDEGDIDFRIIDESEWGDSSTTPNSLTPVSKSSNTWVMDKSLVYTVDITFDDNEGGITFKTMATVYNYHSGRGTAPSSEVLVEINDNDESGAYAVPSASVIHLPPGQRGTTRPSAIAHEFTHIVERGWSITSIFAHGGHDPQYPVEEGSCHWGSCVARGTSIYRYPSGTGYIDIDISNDAQTSGNPPPTPLYARREFQIAGTMWDLNPDLVWDTLRYGGFWPWDVPDTPEKFYTYYKDRDPRPSPTIKGIFQAHGYNTAGWPGKNGQDPDIFTGIFTDSKVDTDGDGFAEYLRVNVEVNIPSAGQYVLTGFIEGMEFGASTSTYLNAGVQNVTLNFYGEEIFESRLNGPYNLSVYLYDENFTLLDFRLGAYLTAPYNYTEFEQPVILFTGNYSDYGIDEDGDGLYDYLILEAEINVSESGYYEIFGNLYRNGIFIDEARNFTYLDKGINSVQLKFDGVTIYTSNLDGPYIVNLSIPFGYGISTSAYSFTEFQRPGASIVEIVSDTGVDINNDGLYDQLRINITLSAWVSGNYILSGHLYDGEGKHITSTYNSTYIASNSNVQLNFDGIAIRNEEKNGQYEVVVELYDDKGAFLGKKTGTTSYYTYTQFQAAPEDIFKIVYNDYGTDLDGNGLYDHLTIEMNISSIKPGNYRLEGYLYDEDGNFVAYDEITEYISDIPHKIYFNFSGQQIWATNILNGKYKLELRIYDDTSTLVVVYEEAYITATYDYTEFQAPVFFKQIFDYGADIDNDGLYNYLTVKTLISISIAKDVIIKGELFDANENKITEAESSAYLDVGEHTVILNFDGYSIFKHKTNGSYIVKLTLKDKNGNVLDSKTYTTLAYSYTDFQHLVALTGYYSDYGRDVDNDGIFDYLTIDVGVFMVKPGNCFIKARLVDVNGEEIVWAENTTWLEAGGQIIQLHFNGSAIYEHGVDGPYYLRDVYVYHTGDPTQSDYVYDAYTTKAYSYLEFGENEPPIANPNGPYEGYVNEPIEFNASASYDPEGMPLTYYWDFGDGSTAVTTQPTITHVYTQAGTYIVTLIVNDGILDSTPATTTVIVNEKLVAPPIPPPLIQLWHTLLNVTGTASTGELDASWELVDYSDNDIGYGFIDVSISEDGKTVTVTIDNAYPGYEATINLNIVNTGSIAAKIGKIELSKNEALEITYPQIEGEVIDVGQKISVPVKVKVNDLAEENSSYSFSLTFEMRQFNK